MINIQNYVQAESLEEAYQLNQKKSGRIIGGMLWMKMARNTVGTAIDLCRLGLDAIEETEEEFSIGAMVALRQLETHPGLNAYTCGAAARAVQDIIGVQFRSGIGPENSYGFIGCLFLPKRANRCSYSFFGC